MFPSSNSFSPSMFFSAYASLAGFLMLFKSMHDFVPLRLRSYFSDLIDRFLTPESKNLTVIIDEYYKGHINEVYDAAVTYLRDKIGPKTGRLCVGKPPKQNHVTISIDKGDQITDSFENFEVKWSYTHLENKKGETVKRYYKLTFEKRFREKVMDSYLSHVLEKSEAMKRDLRGVKLYSRDLDESGWYWGSISLEHPSTFDTLAMDPDAKKKIIDDLERFRRRKEFYKRVGKAWKRGYLLYGPPGTGKSSLIAAMANYLKFDVYDLELGSISDDIVLKKLLLSTKNRSILVVEDIDCNVEVRDREREAMFYQSFDKSKRKVTLSGILNFIDGLWSSFGDERIIVFTTNHKEKLDPALLRPGRMDMHIHMSYCTGLGFRTLVSNYLGLDGLNHPLCEEIERLLDSREVTPAELAEELMKDDDVDVVLHGVFSFVEKRKSHGVVSFVEKRKIEKSKKRKKER